ncbi:MAG: hypothetical protein AB2813_03040 [Candidatus Sedimenticola endophacoides]
MPNSVGHARGEKQVLIIGRLRLASHAVVGVVAAVLVAAPGVVEV